MWVHTFVIFLKYTELSLTQSAILLLIKYEIGVQI